MKKILLLLGLIFCASHAHAATCPVSAGSSSSTIVSTIQGCSSPNTVTFAAGTYTLGSSVNVPCGVSITGPVASQGVYTTGDGTKHWGYLPTAIINWTGGAETTAFNYGACTATHSHEYLEVNMQHPSPDGGQVIHAGTVTSNFTIFGNYFHGNQSQSGSAGGSIGADGLILFDGGSGATPGANNLIEWNRLGTTGDCSNIMNNAASPNSNGVCTGINFATNQTNLTIENNTTDYQEQGLKFAEGIGSKPGSCTTSSGGMCTCLNCTGGVQRMDARSTVLISRTQGERQPPTSGSTIGVDWSCATTRSTIPTFRTRPLMESRHRERVRQHQPVWNWMRHEHRRQCHHRQRGDDQRAAILQRALGSSSGAGTGATAN
jgi:hypothetical protein